MKLKLWIPLLLISLLCFDRAPNAHAQTSSLKIYISADMEGVAGSVTDVQLFPAGYEYASFREIMTNEVNAAIEAAREAGATEILVSDSHGNGQNLLIQKLPQDIQLVRSWPRPLGMMEGIDETFDAAIFIGYHSSTANPEGVRAHSFSSGQLTDVRLNGESVPESVVNAAIAGQFDVPVIMISGDDATIAETQSFLPEIEGAVVKWNLGFHSAQTLMPEAANRLIREKVTSAIKRIQEIKPYKPTTPIELEVQFKNYRPSELLAYLPIVERAGSHGIRFTAKDMVEVSQFLQFVTNYEPTLAP